VTAPSLVIAISLGSGAVALWIAVRYPRFAPARAGIKMLHLAVALAVAQFVAPPAMSLVLHGGDAVGPALLALFLIFLPTQVYAFLSSIWVLALLRNVLQTR
jgi:hypothetical protein